MATQTRWTKLSHGDEAATFPPRLTPGHHQKASTCVHEWENEGGTLAPSSGALTRADGAPRASRHWYTFNSGRNRRSVDEAARAAGGRPSGGVCGASDSPETVSVSIASNDDACK
jgi:hypothetical protein